MPGISTETGGKVVCDITLLKKSSVIQYTTNFSSFHIV
jgi:hypothetical protein